jgi:hypothetical protein
VSEKEEQIAARGCYVFVALCLIGPPLFFWFLITFVLRG